MTDAALLALRYRVVRTIGSGGMGVVYLVEDTRKHNRLMALKTLKVGEGDSSAVVSQDAVVAEGFRAEFRNVHGVVHPNIPEVYDFGMLPDSNHALYFTSEFIDGKPLDTLQEQWAPEQLHVILVSLSRALAFLHSRKLLHRDIKPENVLAKLENGEFVTIKLVDFGLAAHVSSALQEVSGTIDYLAPELIEGRSATVGSDIYALGMLLYRLATGRLPFDAQDPLALAKQRTTAEAPPPLRFRPDLPVGLSDVISSLIRLKPEDRPASARHVIAVLNEREGTDFPYETPASRHAYIRSAASVTNANARALLNVKLRALVHGEQPKHVMVVSLRGLGRTRLLTEFVTELKLEGLPVRLIQTDADFDFAGEEPRACIVPEADLISPARLLHELSSSRDHAWWVIGSETTDAEVCAAAGATETIHLAPMGLDNVRRFITTTFPESNFPGEFAEQIYARTLGLPGAVQAVFDHLLESEMLRIGLSGWELLPGTWDLPLHPHVADFIRHQAAFLSADALWLAQVLSCSAVPLPELVIHNLCNTERCGSDTLTSGKDGLSRLGWLIENDGQLTLAFPAVSRYLSDQMQADERHAWHQRLFQAWSSENVSAPIQQQRELLFHDYHAGTWIVPASDARETLNHAIQEGQNRWVRTLITAGMVNEPPPAMKMVMLHALGDLEYQESDYGAAAECYHQILNHGQVEVSRDNLAAFARYAMLEEKLGNTEHAEQILLRCREQLNEGYDSHAGQVFGTLAWIAFKRGDAEPARQLAEEGLVRVPPRATDAGLALLLNTVATLAFYRGDLDAAAMAWKRCLEVNEAIRDLKGIANMYNNLGVVAAQSGDRLRARSLWEKCAEIAHEIQDMHRLAGIYNNLGIDALETSSLQQAEEYYIKALAMFRRLKSPRDQVELLSNLGELSYYRADYARAQAYWQEAVHLAASVGDREGQVEPLVYLGKLLATLEDLEKAEQTLETARDLAHELSVKKGEGQAWEGLAMLHCRRGEGGQSVAALRNAHMVLSEDVDPLAALHLYLTECAIAAEQGNPEAVQDALNKARKVADTKWDPFTAARTLVCGLLFAQEQLDNKERGRVLRQLSVYPDFLWKYHWALGRRLAAEGALRRALEEYGRGVGVLKAISTRLSDENRVRYLNAPHISTFKTEALALRKMLNEK